ncbi:MAG: DNA polymerase IV [Bacteroidales bacterium]
MTERKIIHIDMDAFYASVEQRDFPEFRGKPLVVGNPERRGVVAAASYEARRYGIRSAMSSFKAKQLCPFVIFTPGRMGVYKEVSSQIHDIFSDYTDLIEPLSLDEAFLDVTENKKHIPLAVDIAKEIKQRIFSELGLVASAGISYNKFLAKIASDYRKPDGLCTIHPAVALDFIARLPIESFWGVGKVTAAKMHELGIHTGAELRACPLPFLIRHFGKMGTVYRNFAMGIDYRPVEPEWIRKSVGCEHTYDEDLTTLEEALDAIDTLLPRLQSRIERAAFEGGRTLTLKVKFNDFTIRNRSCTVAGELADVEAMRPYFYRLMEDFDWEDKSIRLLGISISLPARKSEPEQQLQIPFPPIKEYPF